MDKHFGIKTKNIFYDIESYKRYVYNQKSQAPDVIY